MKTGILHPGEMGISIAATMKNSGHEVSRVTEGRSVATRARAPRSTHCVPCPCRPCR